MFLMVAGVSSVIHSDNNYDKIFLRYKKLNYPFIESFNREIILTELPATSFIDLNNSTLDYKYK